MAVNAIVIVENSKQISLKEFARGLKNDPWGKLAWFTIHKETDDITDSWEEFQWEGKQYFSWRTTPIFRYLGFFEPEVDTDPEEIKIVHITFLKAMLSVEKIAGGPVYVGDDIVDRHTPADVLEDERPFYLPLDLDLLIPGWREKAKIEIDDRYMIF
ncbi:MAG: hypothetical protein JSV88_14255 [Candidatus Aminicenantes bacterium]|nr:MAG: hypothetical protein JSV88_14255 [Candidatus Aminicenantes bacterium]